MAGGNGSRRPSYGTPTLVDCAISWQRIETLNLGLDMRLLNNDLGFTFEWYERNTKDMIVGGESLPLTLGTTAPKGNYGHLRTRGREVALDYQHRFANGLGVNAMLSVSDATTMTVKGADHLIPWENRSLGENFSTGRRYGDIYGYVTDRLYQKDDFVYGEDGKIQTVNVIYRGTLRKTYQQTAEHPVYQVHYENSDKIIFAPGDVKFKDLDGDGYITPGTSTNGNPGDLTVIGNSTPRYEYSFRLGLDYKGFDFSVYFQGVGRRKIWVVVSWLFLVLMPRKVLCPRPLLPIIGVKTAPMPSIPVRGIWEAITRALACKCKASTCSTWLICV